jgi:hypothetical protein
LLGWVVLVGFRWRLGRRFVWSCVPGLRRVGLGRRRSIGSVSGVIRMRLVLVLGVAGEVCGSAGLPA